MSNFQPIRGQEMLDILTNLHKGGKIESCYITNKHQKQKFLSVLNWLGPFVESLVNFDSQSLYMTYMTWTDLSCDADWQGVSPVPLGWYCDIRKMTFILLVGFISCWSFPIFLINIRTGESIISEEGFLNIVFSFVFLLVFPEILIFFNEKTRLISIVSKPIKF